MDGKHLFCLKIGPHNHCCENLRSILFMCEVQQGYYIGN
jgi:hypothetical protein